MKKANGGVAARVKHTRKFTGRRVNKGERRKAKLLIQHGNSLLPWVSAERN